MEGGRELPVGWTVSPLLEAGQLIRGVTYSKNDASDLPFENSIPVLRANNIQDGSLRLEDLVHVPSSLVSEERRIKAGDIVIATSSGSISVVGKAAQAKSDLGAGFGAFCGLVRPSGNLCAGYLGHFFGTDYYRKSVSSMARGVNINNLKRSHFEELSLPLAPLNEQRRIAAKLDATLAAVDACRQRLDDVEALLKRFRQAVLAAATSGELTREWREERGLADQKWPMIKTKEAGKVQLGRQRSPKYHHGPTMRPYLRVQNVFEDRIDLSDVMEMDFSGPDLEKYRLHPGDILLNEGQSPQYLGRPAMYRGEMEEVCFTNSLIRFQARDAIRPGFALLVFRHYMHSGRYISEGTITTNIAHLSAGRFGEVEFPLLTLEEQQEIVRRAQQLFSLADQLEARLTSARKIVERLTPALLAKAFRGELVPQDPNDEPASELLNRIRAARQAEAAASGPSRRGRRQAAANPEPSLFDAAPVPPDRLANLLRECGALSERALLAASELDPAGFRAQLALERELGAIQATLEDGQVLLEAVG
jgi:type I restriction enzyme S subunit